MWKKIEFSLGRKYTWRAFLEWFATGAHLKLHCISFPAMHFFHFFPRTAGGLTDRTEQGSVDVNQVGIFK